MPIASITSISPIAIDFQSFEPDSKIRSTFNRRWDAIEKIEVFKRDFYSYDVICLKVYSFAADCIEIDEEDPSWNLFLKGCADKLDGFSPWESWFSDVAFPAFQPNLTTVFQRRGNTVEQGAAANP